jgi:hypothetical protein
MRHIKNGYPKFKEGDIIEPASLSLNIKDGVPILNSNISLVKDINIQVQGHKVIDEGNYPEDFTP